MAKTDYASVDAYIAAQPEAVRPVLETVRGAIRKGAPGAVEVISYQIPAVRLPGGVVIWFAGWTAHYSLYPVTGGVTEAFGAQLAPYVQSKGTLRFPLGEPVPEALITAITKVRAEEVEAAAAAKRAKAP
jgi:uncharacterized protein YdhG (YjbR/CyaY superfamily)